jgi:hypothetical protein
MKCVIQATAIFSFMMISTSCSKESASSLSSPTPFLQNASLTLTLLQHNWISSESVEIPVYGDSSWGWFGNNVFPYSLNFNKNGTATTYNSIDLTDDQWSDNYAYQLLSDDSTLLFFLLTNGTRSVHADTAKIMIISDSTLVLYYEGSKTASVPDAFHR